MGHTEELRWNNQHRQRSRKEEISYELTREGYLSKLEITEREREREKRKNE